MQYTINVNFRHWKKGSTLERYEYNRLPENVKSQCTEVINTKTPLVVKTSTPPTIKKSTASSGDSQSIGN